MPHLYREVVPHVFPNSKAAHVVNSASALWRRVIVVEPPDGVQHAHQPEAREHQVQEQDDADLCWGERGKGSGLV